MPQLISDAERLEALLESAPDAILELDSHGRISLVNHMVEQLFGYTRQQLLGQTIEVLVPQALRAAHKQHRAQYLHHPGTRPMGSGLQLEARRKDGSHFPVEISLSPVKSASGIYVTAIIRDITDRKSAEQRQHEYEQRFRLMIEAVKDYAIFMLDPDGTVATWNTGAQRIKQYAAEEIIGKHFSIFYPPEERDTKPATVLDLVRRAGKFEEEGWRVRRNGTAFWASVVITAVRSPAGELVGFSKVTRDLTERKQSEDQLRDLREKYVQELELRNRDSEQANQLKTEFLANMSHELRSPLHTIIGFSELLAEETDKLLSDKQKRFLGHIHDDSLHLLDLINDLLDLSKIEAGRLELRREPFNILPVVEEALLSISPRTTEKSLQVRTNISSSVRISADPLRFKQILHNLLGNAVKFTPEGGKISVEAVTSDGFARISISDTGIGIPSDLQQAVFEKFYQVNATNKGNAAGTGLGLAITKRLVEEHGGNIWIESQPGRGSSFRFTIPLDPSL